MGVRTALVTGANKGIGRETARRLGQAGLSVYVGARDVARGEEAARALRDEGIEAQFVHLDLTRAETFAAAAEAIATASGKLDVLVNNAAISGGREERGPASIDPVVVRRVMETNFFGVLELVQAMLPLLTKSDQPRIVNVSSGLGSLVLQADPGSVVSQFKPFAYSVSKAALNMLTIMLAAELGAAGIKVNAADPGYTATDLNNNRGIQSVEEGARASVRLALAGIDGPSGGFFTADGVQSW